MLTAVTGASVRYLIPPPTIALYKREGEICISICIVAILSIIFQMKRLTLVDAYLHASSK